MASLIRQHMADVDGERPIGRLGTNVEIDETLIGGVKKGTHMRDSAGKAVVRRSGARRRHCDPRCP